MGVLKIRIKKLILRSVKRLFSLVYRIEEKVVFVSFGGKQYSDNPRAISEKLHDMYPNLRIVWMLKNNDDKYAMIPSYVKTVSSTLEFAREIVSARCFVTNTAMESDMIKRKGQVFIQTWHGDRGFKKILYDAYDDGKRPIPIIDNLVTDIAVSGSKRFYGEEMYRSAFAYKGKLLKVGSPRNDKLIVGTTNKEKENIKNRLKIPNDSKILLYAPTYRDYSDAKKQNVGVDLRGVLNELNKRGEKWICILRAHTESAGLSFFECEDFIDATQYPDMTDLLLVTDFLITDYSSSCNDFALTGKPVVLTIYDKEEYEENCRGFKVRPEDTGFFIANNNDKLIKIIEVAKLDEYSQRDKKALDYYETYETGYASEAVCNVIHDFCIKNHGKR